MILPRSLSLLNLVLEETRLSGQDIRRSLRSQVSISSLRPIVLMLPFSSQAVGSPSDPRFHCPPPWSQTQMESSKVLHLTHRSQVFLSTLIPRCFAHPCPHFLNQVNLFRCPRFSVQSHPFHIGFRVSFPQVLSHQFV